jgi:21S rRNA (uridine2791-2'-O)-methyltransferase
VQEEVKRFLLDPNRGCPRDQFLQHKTEEQQDQLKSIREQESYIDMERHAEAESISFKNTDSAPTISRTGRKGLDEVGKMVDVVLSDMSAPWEQTTGFWKKSLSGPYNRMMNTSGINFKDHAGSMVCYLVHQSRSI